VTGYGDNEYYGGYGDRGRANMYIFYGYTPSPLPSSYSP